MNDAVLEFARLLAVVRDRAIGSCDNMLETMSRENASVIAKRWRSARSVNHDDLLKMVIADSVDDTLFQLLFLIDEGVLSLSLRDTSLVVAGEQELAGSYMGEWRGLFSKERTYDDFSESFE